MTAPSFLLRGRLRAAFFVGVAGVAEVAGVTLK